MICNAINAECNYSSKYAFLTTLLEFLINKCVVEMSVCCTFDTSTNFV